MPDCQTGGETTIDDLDLFDLLSQLVDKSLVVMEETGGDTRFHLSETVRAYAAVRLREAGEEPKLQRRHFDWSLALAQEASPHFDGPGMQDALDRLEREHDNLRAALSFA